MTSWAPGFSVEPKIKPDPDAPTSQENLDNQCQVPHGERQEPQGEETIIPDELNNTLVIRNNASIDGYSSPFYGKHAPPYSEVNSNLTIVPTNTQGVQEITEIPKHYLDQSTVLKHLAKEIQTQPQASNPATPASSSPASMQPPIEPVPPPRMAMNVGLMQEDNGSRIISMLLSENQAMKAEIEMCHTKILRLEQLEFELQSLNEAHHDAVKANDRREKLELLLRAKLEQEVQKLRASRSQQPDTTDLKQELSKRDVLISQLLGQNKELISEKERKDIEIQAQNVTLAEQRKHIEILDHALTKAQAKIVRHEEEIRKKEFYAERVHYLQKAIQQMQVASERRLEMEKKMRSELEKDLQSLGRKAGDGDDVRKTIREYEEKVVALEGEVARLEQKYLEESALRQMAVDAASVPKDARIAALERNSLETERLITQARSDKLRQMDELHAAQRKCAELESRLKDMESRLAERDAMIRVLQHSSSIHARAASSVALTHHRRTGSKDETIPDRAALDESLKEFGSRLANKAAVRGTGRTIQNIAQKRPSSVSKSTSNLNSAVPNGDVKLTTSAPINESDTEDRLELREWCV
ncbi:angiomotin [Galendromus occidentalis]|uniref:Angiomotin n=1 Tax=Galendromus occidentalis TaxID=34638 RepID=A0AAJ7L6R2_9ACAR|nr:angiomotin [Galendromus occidentalis]